mgnify:CR=1 FL=1|jgi:hypothetical protein
MTVGLCAGKVNSGKAVFLYEQNGRTAGFICRVSIAFFVLLNGMEKAFLIRKMRRR